MTRIVFSIVLTVAAIAFGLIGTGGPARAACGFTQECTYDIWACGEDVCGSGSGDPTICNCQ